MEEQQNEGDIGKKVKGLQKEIDSLNKQLRNLGKDKEEKDRQHRILEKQFDDIISASQELKDQKKQIDGKIRDLKEERETYNQRVKSIAEKLKSFEDQKKSLFGEGRVITSELIKNKIKELEEKIETEPVSFTKEKAMMDKIREYKAEFKKVKEFEAKLDDIRTTKSEIRENKAQANQVHSEIQRLARESSLIYSNLAETSRQIGELKNQRRSAKRLIIFTRHKMSNLNLRLTIVLSDWSKIRDKYKLAYRAQGPRDVKKSAKYIITKFKQKKKLSKDDILALQRNSK